MKPYYQDEAVTLYHGDSLAVLRDLPEASVDCCVTSPPYFGLRDYGEEGQYGLESSPAEYVETMRALFSEVRRVLADDGTLWLNIGDSYYSGRGNPGPNSADAKNDARRGWSRVVDRPGQSWAKPKDLLGIPWRTAFALQDDGWYLRNDIIWAKPNGMPEPVADRLSMKHEHLFLLTKSRRYHFDLDAIREPHETAPVRRTDPTAEHGKGVAAQTFKPGAANRSGRSLAYAYPDGVPGNPNGKNPGDVWRIPTTSSREAHFATMPQELARRAVVAGCKPGGLVLDPFSGSGTTGMVAGQTGRRYVGIDLNRDYLDLSLRTRLAQTSILDFREEESA